MASKITRLLIVMRHAKSDWDSSATSDFDRPLAPRGERDAPRMGRWLREQHYIPQHIVSSPAARARETTVRVVKELGLEETAVAWNRTLYEADVEHLLEVIAKCKAPTTLIVGHNPGLEALVRYLARPVTLPQEEKIMPTAAIVVLELPEVSRGLPRQQAKVVTHMRPRWLE